MNTNIQAPYRVPRQAAGAAYKKTIIKL